MDQENTHEAKWLYFTELHYKGQKFNLTIREGTKHEEIEEILTRMQTTYDVASRLGFSMPGQNRHNARQPQEGAEANPPKEAQERTPARNPAPQASAQTSPASVSPTNKGGVDAPRPDQDDGFLHITKLKITGDLSAPKVEMYSPKERLQYPLLHAPASLVQDMLVAKYGDMDCSALHKCGGKIEVDWTVSWKKSENKSRSGRPYLDIKEIRIWSREK